MQNQYFSTKNKRIMKYFLIIMNKIKIPFLLILFSFFLGINFAEARSGCCSWHGGVCGCSCCDGTSLSDKCAPYYPNCNNSTNYNYHYSPLAPICPSNSKYDITTDTCICNSGYARLNNLSCVKIPENASAVNTETDIWLCNEGFKEIGNTCISMCTTKNTHYNLIKNDCECDSEFYMKNNVCVPKEDCYTNGFSTKITEVINGDNVTFECNGEKTVVHVLGINTSSECFQAEARKKMENLILDKEVLLYQSAEWNIEDNYGELLRYINNGEDVGLTMINEWYALVDNSYSHENLEKYTKAQQEAQLNNKGMWSLEQCKNINAQTKSPESDIIETNNKTEEGAQNEKDSWINLFFVLFVGICGYFIWKFNKNNS